jgi:CDP-diacylglycerol pyrophosphatase
MKSISIFVVLACASLATGCASNAAIKAYATVAEEHASVMKVTFDRCLSEQNTQAKDAACNAVKSSIEAYRQSATELKSIRSTN